MSLGSPDWLADAEALAASFAQKHRVVIRLSDRQLSAAFEIGSLHALLTFYESQGYQLTPQNLTADSEYRYLTSPTGNPANFSYVQAIGFDGVFEIRQQVRVQSHVDSDIAFTPDMVVLLSGSTIDNTKRIEYASGKRPYYRVLSSSVVAAHECKSMNPFPELMVSFIGMLVAAHKWYPESAEYIHGNTEGHLAPTLFVGGTASGLHRRMIDAMQRSYRINIICGLHEGTWELSSATNRLRRLVKTTHSHTADDDWIPF